MNHQAAINLLRSWQNGDPEEQSQTLAVLREALHMPEVTRRVTPGNALCGWLESADQAASATGEPAGVRRRAFWMDPWKVTELIT